MELLLIDDHPLFSDALAVSLRMALPSAEVNCRYSVAEAMDYLNQDSLPDLVLVDLAMPGQSGLDFIEQCRERHSALPIIACSGQEAIGPIRRALALGANAFLSKREHPEAILRAIEQTLAGKGYLPPHLADGLRDTTDGETHGLSSRQLAILKLLDEGMSNQEVADRLCVSLNTVKTHLRLLYDKFDVHNRTDCLNKAAQLGLIRHRL